MYPISVKNLYIGKSGIKISQVSLTTKDTVLVEPITLVGDICIPFNPKFIFEPDYYLNGIWDKDTKTFKIDKLHIGTHSLFITGLPLNYSPNIMEYGSSEYTHIFEDDHRKYLFQVCKTNF